MNSYIKSSKHIGFYCKPHPCLDPQKYTFLEPQHKNKIFQHQLIIQKKQHTLKPQVNLSYGFWLNLRKSEVNFRTQNSNRKWTRNNHSSKCYSEVLINSQSKKEFLKINFAIPKIFKLLMDIYMILFLTCYHHDLAEKLLSWH